MPKRSINEVLAENLKFWMKQAGITSQADLAKKADVAQRTISNYLSPVNRLASKTGKEPSAKLTELAKIADALNVDVWQLVRDFSPRERAFYERVEKAYADLVAEEPSTQ